MKYSYKLKSVSEPLNGRHYKLITEDELRWIRQSHPTVYFYPEDTSWSVFMIKPKYVWLLGEDYKTAVELIKQKRKLDKVPKSIDDALSKKRL